MSIQLRSFLKTKFERGDKPKQIDFADWLDSCFLKGDDEVVEGTGTQNRIMLWNATNGAKDSSVVIDDSGNLDLLIGSIYIAGDQLSAIHIPYDNSSSTLTSSNLQDAVDELDGKVNAVDGTEFNVVKVSKVPGPGEFSSIKDAVDSITTATFTSQWIVKVTPGLFVEDTITMKPYVHIMGSSRLSTIIEVDDPSKNVIVAAPVSSINKCKIQGATDSGSAGIYFSSAAALENFNFGVEECSFGENDILVNVVASTAIANVMLNNILVLADYVQGFVINGGGTLCGILISNSQIASSSITTDVIFASGTLSQAVLSSVLITRIGGLGQNAIRVNDGGSIRVFSGDIRNHTKGVWMENVGVAPTVSITGINMTQNTQDVVVDHTGASGSIQGVLDRTISFIDPSSTVVLQGLDRRIIRVAKLDTDYQSVKDAIDNITDASSVNRYVVSVGPGIFTEDKITLKPYVDVEGSGPDSTYILASDASDDLIISCGNTTLRGIRFGGTTDPGKSIFVHTGDSIAGSFIVTNCNFAYTDRILTQTSVDGVSICLFNECSFDPLSYFTTGFSVTDNGVNPCLLGVGTFSWLANSLIVTGFDDFIKISGSLSKCVSSNLFVGTDQGNIGGEGLHCIDGAIFNVSSLQLHGFNRAFYAENNGAAPTLSITAAQLVNNNTDLEIEHTGTLGSFQGTADMTKVVIDPSSSFNIAIQDLVGGSFNISNSLNVKFPDGTLTDVSTLIVEGSPMGLIQGGIITEVGSPVFSVEISEGFGYLEKFPDTNTLKRIDWVDTILTFSADSDNYIFFNYNGILTVSGSYPDTFFNILIGRVKINSTGIEFIDASPLAANHIGNRFSETFKKAVGPIYSSGSIVSEYSGSPALPFHLDVTGGIYYFGENKFSPSGGSNVDFTSYYQDGSGGHTKTFTNIVDSSNYDDGSGTLAPLTSGYYAKHSFYSVGQGINEKYFVVYAQNEYANLLEVQEANIPSPPTYFREGVVLIAGIIVQEGAPSITQIRDLRPVIGFKAEGVNASADHGSLSGLTDDDHPQYLLTDGSRSLTGDLDLGGNNIINANLINGASIVVDPSVSTRTGGSIAIDVSDTIIATASNITLQSDHSVLITFTTQLENTAGAAREITWKLFRDGGEINSSDRYTDRFIAADDNVSRTYHWFDSPGAGTFSYSVRAIGDATGVNSITNRRLTIKA